MKRHLNTLYILGMVILGGLFSACSKEDPTLFGSESDGFYFNYDSKDELTSTINFADSVVTEPEVGYVPVRIRLLGHLSDKETPITLKADAVDGYDEAKVTLPKVELKAGAYDTTVYVAVARPTREDVTYAAKISFEQGDKSMKDFDNFIIYAKESYTEPSNWADDIYGAYSKDKFKFIAKTLGNAKFCDADNYVQCNTYNPSLVTAVREWHQANPGQPIPYDIPFLNGDYNYGGYDQPDYWGDLQDKYFGEYSNDAFGTLAAGLGATTQNEEQLFGSTDESVLLSSNKTAVGLMMENYNNLFRQGYNYWGFNSAFSVPIVDGVDYDIVEPAFWTDEQTKSMIEKYYGAYSADKYKKMIQIAKRELGDGFKLFLLFPVSLQWDDASMQNVPVWDNDANLDWMYFGEQVIYHFYEMFKAEEPNLFPDGVQEPEGGDEDYYAKKSRAYSAKAKSYQLKSHKR